MNETLLYIILGILYLIFTIIGRVAKKRQQPSPSQEPWSLEDALADLQGYPEQQPDITPVPESYIPDQQIYQSLEADDPQYSEISQRPSTPPQSDSEPAVVEKSHNPSALRKTPSMLADQFKNPEDAQTAIILSEILGKPKGSRRFSKPRSRY